VCIAWWYKVKSADSVFVRLAACFVLVLHNTRASNMVLLFLSLFPTFNNDDGHEQRTLSLWVSPKADPALVEMYAQRLRLTSLVKPLSELIKVLMST
jgi:hypothetical protein